MKLPRQLFEFKVLQWLMVCNIIASILHYGDNLAFFHEYPEPVWLRPGMVDAFWFVMTPVGLLGVWLAHRRWRASSSFVLLLYAAMSLLVLGHYRFAPFHEIRWRIHAFIWIEALGASALVVWLVGSWLANSGRVREPSGAPMERPR